MKRTMEPGEGTTDSISLPPIGTSAMINDKSDYNLNKFIDEYSQKEVGGNNLYKTPDRGNF